MSMADSTIVERLGAFAAGLRFDRIPHEVQGRAKACLLHALAVGRAGSVADFGRRAEEVSVGWSDRPGVSGFARSLVSGQWHTAEAAAFINGVHLHARAQEDTHGTFHPGVCVIPAALAAVESADIDGATMLVAIVAGYEVGIALSAFLTELTTPPFRATAVFGPVAAAAAVGRIRNFDTETMTSALAIAASLSGGTAESFGAGSDEWHFQSGTAAAQGLRAADLAASGVVGSRTAFEAPSGFLECYAQRAAIDIADRLGRTWNMLGVTFKPYPVCAFNQTPAMLAARMRRDGLRAQDVSAIRLSMNEREATYPGMPATGPFTSVAGTLMSARFAFASALVHGDISYGTLTDFTNPDVLQLIDKIELQPEAERPPKTARAQVTVSEGTDIVDAIEDSQPMLSWSFDEVVRNAERLAAEVDVSAGYLGALVDAVGSAEQLRNAPAVLNAFLMTLPVADLAVPPAHSAVLRHTPAIH